MTEGVKGGPKVDKCLFQVKSMRRNQTWEKEELVRFRF